MLNNTINFSDLPAPPESLLAVIRACSESETRNEDIAGLIKAEPVLTAELLKIVNSAYYGFVSEINSIDRMTVMMGLKAIRNLALCIAMRDISKNKVIAGFDDKLFWQDSVRRGVISGYLAQQLNLDKDECFTAGVLQDIGLLVLFSQNDNHQEFVEQYRQYNPDLRAVLEQDEFSMTHNAVAAFLNSQWGLPETLVTAIFAHHQQEHQTLKRPDLQLSKILYCADWLNAFFTLKDKEGTYHQCRKIMTEQLEMDAVIIDQVMAALPDEISMVGEALGYQLEMEGELDDILHNGSKKLAEHNLELQELTWRLKKTIDDRDKLSAVLKQEVQIARDVQVALLPAPNATLPIHAFNVPAGELSGDFYDYFTGTSGQIYFCLGDVSGKGVYASLLMVKASSLFRSLCQQEAELVVIVEKMNEELCRVVVRGMFVTMVIGCYDPVTHELRFVSAGHLPALCLDKDGGCRTIEACSPPLGILTGQEFKQESINIKGACLYLYSDGVTESYLGKKSPETAKMLGIDGLVNILKRLNNKPVESRLKTILKSFQNSQKQLHDDTTMLLLDGTVTI